MNDMRIERPELICLDLIDTLMLRHNSQFTECFVEQLGIFGIEKLNVQKAANRIREKYIEYSFGNYSNDDEYLRSILLYYVDRSTADGIIPSLKPVILNHFEPIAHCREFLEYCALKYTLVLASNFIVHWMEELLEKYGFAKYFERTYVSSQIRYRKPAKQFFSVIINDYPHIKPSKMLMIGDSIVNDYHGARESGLSSVIVNKRLDNSSFFHRPDISMTIEEIKQYI